MDDARTEAQIVAALIEAEANHHARACPLAVVTSNNGDEEAQMYGVNLSIPTEEKRVIGIHFQIPFLEPDRVQYSVIKDGDVKTDTWELRDPFQLGQLVKELICPHLPKADA
jgi:hypothetical protein